MCVRGLASLQVALPQTFERVKRLIHTGLEPGDRGLGEIRETVERFRLLPGPLSFEHEAVTSPPRLRNR